MLERIQGPISQLPCIHLLLSDHECHILQIPSDILSLFDLPVPSPSSSPQTHQFYTLLSALKAFTSRVPYALPLSATLPDMHTSTESYVHLQKLYRARAEEEKTIFKELLKEEGGETVDGETVDSFLKNCHALKVLKGKKWGAFDADRDTLGVSPRFLESSILSLSLVDLSIIFFTMQRTPSRHVRKKPLPTSFCLHFRPFQPTLLPPRNHCALLSRISLGRMLSFLMNSIMQLERCKSDAPSS